MCLFMEKSVYAYLYIYVSCKYIFIFYDFGTKLEIFFCIYDFFIDPAQRQLWSKAKFWEDSKSQYDKTQFEGEQCESVYEQQSIVF